jgi:hypothetical protein
MSGKKYTITDRPYKQIEGPQNTQPVIHIPSKRTTSIIVSRFTIIMALIGGMIMMGYAGAEVGFLVGGAILFGVSYAIFEVMLRAGHSILTSAISGVAALLFLFAADLDENIMGNTIRAFESLQKISHAGLVVLVLIFLARLFKRKE